MTTTDVHFGTLEYRGQVVRVTEDPSVLQNREAGKFYYGMRHGDSDWGVPITVEPFVLVNRWGVMITDVELQFDDPKDKWHNLTRKERRAILQALGYID